MKTVTCSNCGAAIEDPKQKNCEYCGAFLLRLSPFERVAVKGKDAYFRSLRILYHSVLIISLGAAVLIFFVFFDNLSEEVLVKIAPIWFLGSVFGACGLYGEKAVRYIIARKADTYSGALKLATASIPPLGRLMVYLVFTLPLSVINPDRRSSPLLFAFITTICWAGVLYIFLYEIFPSL